MSIRADVCNLVLYIISKPTPSRMMPNADAHATKMMITLSSNIFVSSSEQSSPSKLHLSVLHSSSQIPFAIFEVGQNRAHSEQSPLS
jgi:hypothetical protein